MNAEKKECKKILLVEDEELIAKLFRRRLNRKSKSEEEQVIAVYWADNLEEAEKLFKIHKNNLDAVVLDACVPGREINTIPFLGWILKQGFKGSIIANSSIPDYNIKLMEKGATHSCSKNEVPIFARKLLT